MTHLVTDLTLCPFRISAVTGRSSYRPFVDDPMEASAVGFFFFQAEDGIRDVAVTGVQTCALPISVIEPFTNQMKFPCDLSQERLPVKSTLSKMTSQPLPVPVKLMLDVSGLDAGKLDRKSVV